ncbi:DUF6563 family protein [Parapedobacter pyrenivorans]|nr:DUF6563 family protein [Parapedobacter pyrenivorans]
MKHILFALISCLASTTSFGQTGNDTMENLRLKRGIYFSFREIVENNPSYTDTVSVKERTDGHIAMWGGGKYTFELADAAKHEVKPFKRALVGVSDGETFYISDRHTIGGWQGLTKCLLTGPYLVAPIRASASAYTGGGLIPAMIKVGEGFVINVNAGTSAKLTEKYLKGLMSKHPEIADRYAEAENLMDAALEIIDEINRVEQGSR